MGVGNIDLQRLVERIQDPERRTRKWVAGQCFRGFLSVLDNKYKPLGIKKPVAACTLPLFDEAYFRLEPAVRRQLGERAADYMQAHAGMTSEAVYVRHFMNINEQFHFLIQRRTTVREPQPLAGLAKYEARFVYPGITSKRDFVACAYTELLAPAQAFTMGEILTAIPSEAVSFRRAERYAEPNTVVYEREI